MAAHRDSDIPSHGKLISNAGISGFESTFKTSQDVLVTLPDRSSGSSSSMEDADARSRETVMTCGDSGFSEMELTSPGSETTFQEPDNNCFSSMEVPEDDDDDDVSSTISELSGMSDLSGQDWKPSAGPMGWIQRQMFMGADPRQVLAKIVRDDASLSAIPDGTDDLTLWKIIVKLIADIPWRKKLNNVNTMDDVVGLIRRSSRILVLTGAGVSVSCGIPDFRSPQGIYARLARDFPDLPDPHAMFDIHYFNRDPRPFYKFAREIYPGQFQPSPCHKFIRALESHGKLLRNYTQNIDTLEQVAGIQRVVQCHGSFATATCTNCKRKVGADAIRDDILAQRIPVCTVCVPDASEQAIQDPESYSGLVARGVMKPDIVFFGEGLPEDFHKAMAADRDQADLLLIIGSSLKVQPVALIPSSVPASVPQVLINREPLPDCRVDVELLGDADVLVDHLCRELGDDWGELCWRDNPLVETETLLAEDVSFSVTPVVSPTTTGASRKRPATSLVASCSPEPAKRARTDEEQNSIHEEPMTNDIHEAPMSSPGMDVPSVGDHRRTGDCVRASLDVEVATSSGSQSGSDYEWRDARHIKLRQMSSDSTRDSGIAEPIEDRPPLPLSARLPENTYMFVAPNRYIFPGAEVYPPVRSHTRASSVTDSDLDTCSPSSSASPLSSPASPPPGLSE